MYDLFNCFLVVYDASDIIFGNDEDEDFESCIKEISHIRQCLKLSTQISKRRNRQQYNSVTPESRTPPNSDDQAKHNTDDIESNSDDDESDLDESIYYESEKK